MKKMVKLFHASRILTIGTLLCCTCTAPHTAHALDLWPFDDGVDYDMKITGVSAEMQEEFDLETIAKQAIDEENPPETLEALQSYTSLMSQRVQSKMQAEAYYDANVRATLDEQTENSDDPLVTINVTPGQQYIIGQSEIVWDDAPILVENTDKVFLEQGTTAKTEAILETVDPLTELIDDGRCFLSLNVEPLVVLERFDGLANVRYRSQHGRAADFGETTFVGETSVNEDVLRRRIKWEQGECFTQAKVDATQTALLQSQLLSSATISYPKMPNDERQIPVTIEITDRPHRTLTAGASYNSDEGAGVTLGWEHRNLFGEANRLNLRASIAQREWDASAKYSIPYFYMENQRLNLSGSIKQEDYDSFESESISALASIDRQLTPNLLVGVGGGVRISNVTEAGEESENFGLIYVPAYVQWDSRDSVLDPKKGIYAQASISPYTDFTGQGVSFIKTEGTGQTYLTAESWPLKPTLALRVAAGQINGASTDNVPADLRFYAGGGGSVRGYSFRALGPQDNGEPNGGTVWTEGSIEARMRFTDSFGGVVFVDGGTVYEADTLAFDEELFFSAGAGVRYFSPIGPIRFDVGVPLDDIENEDNNFGVYVSIGQAF